MYLVLTKDDFGDTWQITECQDLAVVKEAILAATRAGRELKVAIPMEFSIDVKIEEESPMAPTKWDRGPTARQKREREVAENEAKESGSEEDKGSGSQSNSPV